MVPIESQIIYSDGIITFIIDVMLSSLGSHSHAHEQSKNINIIRMIKGPFTTYVLSAPLYLMSCKRFNVPSFGIYTILMDFSIYLSTKVIHYINYDIKTIQKS